jgi:hypothetical protein
VTVLLVGAAAAISLGAHAKVHTPSGRPLHCLWALEVGTTDARVIVHSVAGCLFYGAYATALTTLLWLAAAGFAIGALIALQ